MTEIGITVALSLFTALGAATQQLHRKIDDLDKRVDGHELRVAEHYISKTEFRLAMEKVEQHLLRIETKMDKLT